MYIVVGLGNPGEEYKKTRHNVGRLLMSYLVEKEIEGVKLVHLDSFMNKSGSSVAKVVKSKKSAKSLIVIYDDLDLALGTMKLSYDRGSGGHRGVESIIKALGTREFIRVRIGISPTIKVSAGWRIKKPKGEKEVENFILGDFKKSEEEILKKVFKKAFDAISKVRDTDVYSAMTEFNY